MRRASDQASTNEVVLNIQLVRIYEALMFLAEMQASREGHLNEYARLEEDHAAGRYRSAPPALTFSD